MHPSPLYLLSLEYGSPNAYIVLSILLIIFFNSYKRFKTLRFILSSKWEH